MREGGSIKIVNIITQGYGCGYIGDIVKMLNFIKIFFSSLWHRVE